MRNKLMGGWKAFYESVVTIIVKAIRLRRNRAKDDR